MKKVTLDVRYLLQLDLTGVRLSYCNEPLHKVVSLPKVLLVAVIPDKVVLHLLDFHLVLNDEEAVKAHAGSVIK